MIEHLAYKMERVLITLEQNPKWAEAIAREHMDQEIEKAEEKLWEPYPGRRMYS